MRWSKLKQLVENRMAPSLQRRVEVHSTWYRHLGHDQLGRAWITVDKREVANMCDSRYWNQAIPLVREIRLVNSDSHYDEPGSVSPYDQARTILHERDVYERYEMNKALLDSLSLSIDDALRSANMLIRAFAMLDSRLGKRRLCTLQLGDEHPLVRQFYDLRCEAEGIKPQIAAA